MIDNVEVFTKDKCCGCGACKQKCPKGAISLCEDPGGFLFPVVNSELCTSCGLCLNVCDFNKCYAENKEFQGEVFAAIHLDEESLMLSASGGAFMAFANYIIENNGVVCGAAWDTEMNLVHVGITRKEELYRLQGSKYVQSDTGSVFVDIKNNLTQGKMVLFSGTPCQCGGLRGFIGSDYHNLYCIEILCHGVPSSKMLKAYFTVLEKRFKEKIVDARFRDKKRGWGGLLNIVTERGKLRKRHHHYLSVPESSYYQYFWDAAIYRESCYVCRYAKKERESDITIGDFWGVQRFLDIDYRKGVSVILVNTEKGKKLIGKVENSMRTIPVTYDMAALQNGQLHHPSLKHKDSEEIMRTFIEDGYAGIEEQYIKYYKKAVYIAKFKRLVPLWMKNCFITLRKAQVKNRA